MSAFTLDAIVKHLDNAQTIVRLAKDMRCAQRQYLLGLGLSAVIESLELLRLEVRGERAAAAPVISGADDLEAAETGTSPLVSPSRDGDEPPAAPAVAHEQIHGLRAFAPPPPLVAGPGPAQEEDGVGHGSRSPSPDRAPFLEPLRASPVATPRPALLVEEPAPAAADGQESVTTASANYKDLLAAAGNPGTVYLRMPKYNRWVELPVDYTHRQPMSQYVEPSGATFRGTLRRVAGRAKYLAGYVCSLDTRDAPESEKRAMVDMKREMYFRNETGAYEGLGARRRLEL